MSVAYGERTVVEGLSFQINRGQIFGLLGPNGAGKTLLARTGYIIVFAFIGIRWFRWNTGSPADDECRVTPAAGN